MKTVAFLFLLSCSAFVSSATTEVARPLSVCLTGSTEGIIPAYGEAFKNGAQMAVDEYVTKHKRLKPEIKTYFYEATPFASARATQQMLNEGCAVIIGYSTMNELLAAQEVIKKSPIPVISIYGETDKRFLETPFIITLEPPVTYLIKHFTPKLKEMLSALPSKRALLLTAADQQAPLEYRKGYQELLRQQGFQVDNIDFLERMLDIDAIRRERGKSLVHYDVIFILSRSVNASNLMDLLTELGAKPSKPLIIATKNLGSAQLPAFLDRLKNKEVSVFFPRYNCTAEKRAAYQNFLTRYKARTSREAMILSAETFDAVNYILTAAGTVNSTTKTAFSPHEILSALKKTRYQGITRTKFLRDFKVSYSGHFVINVTKDGYNDVTERPRSEPAK